ncbi:hypothetical protein ABB07_24505 [Streptomyces incarnatus]|uniref:Uncharacterized protein n=1 Tax=Streptomyces incarnatus TaxID=665007 RepID=A0ABN4GMR3_9ACTN|nr:hypothetical protein ABB07_24505 [Streptomyces incarnatus]
MRRRSTGSARGLAALGKAIGDVLTGTQLPVGRTKGTAVSGRTNGTAPSGRTNSTAPRPATALRIRSQPA